MNGPMESQRRYLKWGLGRLRVHHNIAAGTVARKIQRLSTDRGAQTLMEEVAQIVRDLDEPETAFGQGRAVPVVPDDAL